jgi:hypothetical protein
LLGFTLIKGVWMGVNDDRVDEAKAFIAGFEAEPIGPSQKINPFLLALSKALPFGEKAVVDKLGESGPYVNRAGRENPITKDLVAKDPNLYAKPKY